MKKISMFLIGSILTIFCLTASVLAAETPAIDILKEKDKNGSQIILNNIPSGTQSIQLEVLMEGSFSEPSMVWKSDSTATFQTFTSESDSGNTKFVFYIDGTSPLASNGVLNIGTLKGSSIRVLNAPTLKVVDKSLNLKTFSNFSVTHSDEPISPPSGGGGGGGTPPAAVTKPPVPIQKPGTVSKLEISVAELMKAGKITLDNGTEIYVDADDLKDLNGNITFTMTEVQNDDKLKTFTITMTNNSKEITSFKKPITIVVPYIVPENIDPDSVLIYYLPEKGGEEKITMSMVDVQGQKIIFKINHLSKFAIGTNAKNFTDVPKNQWYYKDIMFLSARDVINGFAGNVFKPTDPITRCEIIALIANLEKPIPTDIETVFSDVSANDWFAPYVSWGVSNGILSGMGDGTFEPKKNITREELSIVISNYIKYKTGAVIPTVTATKFADDSSISQWSKSAVAYLADNSLISGKGNNNFAPQENTMRAEAASILKRYITSGISVK